MRALGRWLLGNLWRTLAATLGVVQALIVEWLAVVVFGDRLRQTQSPYLRTFVDFLDQPKAGRILAFAILFRAGESFLMKMKYPFLTDEMGMTLVEYGIANGTVGIIASFTATMLGTKKNG